MKKVGDWLGFLEKKAPTSTAADWDNVGLLAGDPEWKTAGAVVSIDLTEEAIERAEAKGFRLIVNHHPCIFPRSRGLARVTSSDRQGTGRLVFQALRKGIAVVACHTNFDICALEVTEAVSRGLGAEPQGRLFEKGPGSLVKLSVFVPLSHVDSVRGAICEAGAGHVGNYDFCTFASKGEGTFRGQEKTQPYIGIPGVIEKAEEVRLETIIPRGLERQVVAALCNAHPYEEVAYDIFPVEQPPGRQGLVGGLGYGFWGSFSRPRAFSDLAQDVKRLFQLNGFWVTGKAPSKVRKVGFVAGKGADFIPAAVASGCDVFITGEAGYHSALEGARRGVTVLELGHRESEVFFLSTLKSWLAEAGMRSWLLEQPTQKLWLGGKK